MIYSRSWLSFRLASSKLSFCIDEATVAVGAVETLASLLADSLEDVADAIDPN